jgi:hypothetical protein
MKKLHIHNALKALFLVIVLLSTSCKDWLTLEPEDKLIKEKFWTKTADVEGALAAAYNALRESSMQSLIFGELRADLVNFTGDAFSNYQLIAASNISPTNSAVDWSNYYSAINLANTLMHFDDEVFEKDQTFTQEMMDGIEAEALFIRSVAYFYLVRLWKDVSLVLEASVSDTGNLFLPKSPEYVVVDQIINDLLTAKDLAYKTEFYGTDYFYGSANYYSILALLADVYLWSEQYQKCIETCDEVTASGLFSLEPTETMFNIYYPGNSTSEGIIEIQFNDALDQQENPIYYNMISFSGGSQASIDNRTLNMIMDREDLRMFNNKLAIWKYQGKDILGLVPRSFTERDANWILYRYADILLMKAEACIEVGRFDDANELIGETLTRAAMPYDNYDDLELLRQELLDERGREFLFEGKRWFDLLRAAKRNHFAKKDIIIDMILSGADIKQQAILRTRVYDTLSYYLPIPERELIYNQNLEQNPYYDR